MPKPVICGRIFKRQTETCYIIVKKHKKLFLVAHFGPHSNLMLI